MDILNHHSVEAEIEDQIVSTKPRSGRQLERELPGAPSFSAGHRQASQLIGAPRSQPPVFASAPGRPAPSLSLARCPTSAVPFPARGSRACSSVPLLGTQYPKLARFVAHWPKRIIYLVYSGLGGGGLTYLKMVPTASPR